MTKKKIMALIVIFVVMLLTVSLTVIFLHKEKTEQPIESISESEHQENVNRSMSLLGEIRESYFVNNEQVGGREVTKIYRQFRRYIFR